MNLVFLKYCLIFFIYQIVPKCYLYWSFQLIQQVNTSVLKQFININPRKRENWFVNFLILHRLIGIKSNVIEKKKINSLIRNAVYQIFIHLIRPLNFFSISLFHNKNIFGSNFFCTFQYTGTLALLCLYKTLTSRHPLVRWDVLDHINNPLNCAILCVNLFSSKS